MVNSYSHFDRNYRRGLVLGLSLAELFLVLLFLLLLASFGITSLLKEEQVELQNKIKNIQKDLSVIKDERDDLKDQLSVIASLLGNEIEDIDPLFLENLIKKAGESKSLKDQLDSLSTELGELKNKLENVKKIESLIDNEGLTAKNIQDMIEDNRNIHELDKLNSKLKSEIEELTKAQEDLRKELQGKELQIAGLKLQLTDKDIAINKINEQLEASNDKGKNPPCWFRRVKDEKAGVGATRQREVKIFDIKIIDDGFFVIEHDNDKTPRPIDFGNVENLPEISSKYLNTKLSAQTFLNVMKPFALAGENKKIQPYECNFMVDMYDYTSEANKDGYKKNVETVQRRFLTYEVKEDKWPLN